jgi:hypothetical protein
MSSENEGFPEPDGALTAAPGGVGAETLQEPRTVPGAHAPIPERRRHAASMALRAARMARRRVAARAA